MKNIRGKGIKQSFIDSKFYRFPFAYLIILLLIFIVYGQALTFRLGKLDETNIILENIATLKDFHNLKTALISDPFFHKTGAEFYRPVQNLSFMADAHLSGTDGWAYYLSNILLHFITCSLLFYLLKLVGSKKRIAFLMTLAFALHPLFVQTVAWAPSRGDLFLAMFSLAAFISFIHFIRSGKLKYMFFCSGSFAIAMFSKETAVILPVICLLWYLLSEGNKKLNITRIWTLFLIFAVIFAIFIGIRNFIVMVSVSKGQFGLTPFIVHLRTIPEFIFKFFLPFGLGPTPGFTMAITIGGLIILAGMIYIVIRFHKDSGNIYFFGLAWFLLFTVPALIYINKFGALALDYMEHRAYLPSAGILIFVCMFISRFMKSENSASISILLVFLIILFGLYTRIYSGNYRTPRRYYDLAIENNPKSAIAWFNRGATSMNSDKDYRSAIHDYDVTMSLSPGYAEAYINRGFCREQLNDTEGAVADYMFSAKLKPGWYEPHVNLATVFGKMGMVRQAKMQYDTALDLLPSFIQGYNERGALLVQLGEVRAAMEDFNKAISMNDRYPEAYFNRALLEFQEEAYSAAMEDYDRALLLNREYIEAWVNRGVLKYRMQDFTGAISDFSEAVTLDDTYAEAYLDRGMARYMANDLNGACQDWSAAKGLKNQDAESFIEKYCNK